MASPSDASTINMPHQHSGKISKQFVPPIDSLSNPFDPAVGSINDSEHQAAVKKIGTLVLYGLLADIEFTSKGRSFELQVMASILNDDGVRKLRSNEFIESLRTANTLGQMADLFAHETHL